jgi:hypothetical protein
VFSDSVEVHNPKLKAKLSLPEEPQPKAKLAKLADAVPPSSSAVAATEVEDSHWLSIYTDESEAYERKQSTWIRQTMANP